MKRNKIITASLMAAILLSSYMLSSCSASLVNLKYGDEKFYNKRLGISYYAAPTCYEPVSIGEAYGYYGDIDMTFYQITGLDPKKWLTEADSGTATTIFYNENITLPTLEEFNPDTMYLCLNGSYTYSIATITDEEVLSQLVDLYMNGEQADWPLINANAVYSLKFHSEETMPELYYSLTYSEFDEGNFIYERYSRRCVNVGNILYDLIN